jgi:molybdopterin-binding protein
MKISARNQFPGTVVEVRRGAVNGTIKVDIGGGHIVTASITNDAIDELALREGEPATVLVKASDVLIGK